MNLTMLRRQLGDLSMSIKLVKDKITSSGAKRKKKKEQREMQEWEASEQIILK